MLLLRQFLSELDDSRTQCSPVWFVYMVLTDSRSTSYDVTDDVITYNHCRKFGAKYLGNEARKRDGSNSLYKLAYGLSIGRGPDDIT